MILLVEKHAFSHSFQHILLNSVLHVCIILLFNACEGTTKSLHVPHDNAYDRNASQDTSCPNTDWSHPVFLERISKYGLLIWTMPLTHFVTPGTHDTQSSNYQGFSFQDWEVGMIIVLAYRVVRRIKWDHTPKVPGIYWWVNMWEYYYYDNCSYYCYLYTYFSANWSSIFCLHTSSNRELSTYRGTWSFW